VLEIGVLVEIDNSGEVEGLILLLGLVVVDPQVDGQLELAGMLEDCLNDEGLDETTVETVMRELLQVVVAFGTNEELPGEEYWRTAGATGFENEMPARAMRQDRPIICFNAISVGGL
jgi:hypothetical protein